MSKKVSRQSYDLSSYFDLPNPGLRTFFTRVRDGQKEIYTSPWIKAETNAVKLKQMSKILKEWLPHLDKLEKPWPGLFKFENDLAAKVGPLSVMKPLSERYSDIEAYYNGITLPAEPIATEAIDATVRKFNSVRGLSVRSNTATVDKMKLSTNSGNPFFTKRRNVLDKTVPVLISGDHQILNGDEWPMTAIIGWRGQEGGIDIDDVKQRVVWMFPFGVNVAELGVYQPLISATQRFNLIPAWVGMDSVDKEITHLFDTKGKRDLIVCTDFTKFDQHFNPAMQDCAYSILSQILDNDEESHRWLQTVFPIKYNIPLAVSESQMYKGQHGMGSGSGGTNADETLAHTALQFEAAMKSSTKLNPHSMCLGDDGILTFPGITAEKVTDSYSSHGLEMNLSKQEESTQECTYLRRWHHYNYRIDGVCAGVYATTRALGRLCMQERFYDPELWGPKMVALRELSIIENCKYHPLKEEFAEFCMKRDKYRLGLDIPGFLDSLPKLAKDATAYMSDFLGYTRSLSEQDATRGIDNWWIVNYLKSKR